MKIAIASLGPCSMAVCANCAVESFEVCIRDWGVRTRGPHLFARDFISLISKAVLCTRSCKVLILQTYGFTGSSHSVDGFMQSEVCALLFFVSVFFLFSFTEKIDSDVKVKKYTVWTYAGLDTSKPISS